MSEARRVNSAVRKTVSIEVLDLETGIQTVYSSIGEASRALGVFKGTISNYFLRNTQTRFWGDTNSPAKLGLTSISYLNYPTLSPDPPTPLGGSEGEGGRGGLIFTRYFSKLSLFISVRPPY